MLKKLSKIIKATTLCLFLSSIFVSISPALAIDPIKFRPQIDIGIEDPKNDAEGIYYQTGELDATTNKNKSDLLPKYIKAIYQYAIGAVGIVAAVVMMYGGVLWIASMGNAERSSDAKSWIFAALSGLVLTLSAYSILYVVNPDLLNFKSLRIESIKGEKIDEETPPAAKTFTTHISSEDMTNDKNWARNNMRGTCINKCGGKAEYLKNVEITSEEKRPPDGPDGKEYKYWTAMCHCKVMTCAVGIPESITLKEAEKCETTNGTSGYCFAGKCLTEKGGKGDPCGEKPGSTCVDGGSCGILSQDRGGRGCEGTYLCCKK